MSAAEHVTRHIQRAERMAVRGEKVEALAYLAHLADIDLGRAEGVREHGRDDARTKELRIESLTASADRYLLAYRVIAPELAGIARDTPTTSLVRVTEESLPLTMIPASIHSSNPSISSPVASPHWPALDTHGLWITCDDRTAQRRGFWLEMQLLFPDALRTQLVLHRRVESIETARFTVGLWAAIGFSALAAEADLHKAGA